MPRAKTFAEELRAKFSKALSESRAAVPTDTPIIADEGSEPETLSSLFGEEDVASPAPADAGDDEPPEAPVEVMRKHPSPSTNPLSGDDEPPEAPVDVMDTHKKAAIAKVASDKALIERIRKNGIPWKGIVDALEQVLPDVLADRNKVAYDLVPRFLTETFGERDKGWETKKQPKKDGSGTMVVWVYAK